MHKDLIGDRDPWQASRPTPEALVLRVLTEFLQSELKGRLKTLNPRHVEWRTADEEPTP